MNAKKEKLLNETYQKWMQAGLYDLPLDNINEFIDPKIMGYGTAIDEKVLSISEYKQLINRQREQAVGIEIVPKITPIFRSVTNKEDAAIFVDEINVQMIIDSEKHELFLRITTLLEYIDSNWIVVHWHGSIPTETKAEDDAWLVNEWKRKNAELEKLVSEKTSELINKNRELEIETALEKVRSSALSLKQPGDMVDVCLIISDQLELLGVNDIRNVQTAIINEQRGTYLNYQYFTAYNKSVIEETEYHKHPTVFAMVEEMKKSANSTFNGIMKGKELITFREWRKLNNQFPDPILDKVDSVHYYFYSIGLGGLGLTTYKPLPEEGLDVFKRFHNVFTLAYRRFVDIEIAIAQAKEAQIEAALERVRSRSLAMHHTSELQDVINTVYQQFKSLEIDITGGAFIAINEENKNEVNCWGAGGTADYVERVHIPFIDRPIYTGLIVGIKKGPGFFTEEFRYEEKIEFFNHLFKLPPYTDAPPERKEEIMSRHGGYTRSCAVSKYTSVFIINHHGRKFLEEENNVLIRFGKVFEQSYTRFLDLKKAEGQAREAKIEAALERTRTQSMLMQHSKELDNTLRVFHEQVLLLGIQSAFSFLWLPDEKQDRHIFWAAWGDKNSTDFSSKAIDYPLDRDEPATAQCLIDWKGKEPVVSYHVPPDGVESYFAAWQELIAGVEELSPKYFSDGLYYVEAFMKYGCFGVMVKSELSEEEKKILYRFTIEFERTYTRFLDLQKAEAQARQAQIETAMEKVRARALAMQKPAELVEVAQVLRKEMGLLGVEELETSSIYIHDEKSGTTECWYAIQDVREQGKKLVTDHMTIKLNETWVGREMSKFYNSDQKQTSILMKGENRKEWINYCAEHSEVLQGYYGDVIPERTYHLLKFSNGYMGAASPSDISTESWELLQRATSVFSLAYTRFSDLQQAEAQAREAQIEVALERVRSRTMAMHKSDELAETAAVLFQQMTELGITPERITIGLIKEETRVIEVWSTNQEGIKINHQFNVSLDEPTSGKRIYEAWKEKKKSLIIDLSGQELNDWIRYVREVMGMTIKEELVKEHRVHSVALFSHGMVLTTTPEPLPEESMHLLERFADVFNLTYRRFLDLKQAEAQAREAQIEGALERVRSKTIAMHNSNDVGDTVVTLFDEVLKLGLDKSIRCGIGILEGNEKMETWSATSHPNGKVDLKMGMLNMTIHPMLIGLKKAWESGETSYSYDFIGDDVLRYYKALNNEPEYPFQADLESLPENEYHKSFFYSEGILFSFAPNPISDEAAEVLDRFARVFGQTYRRYLDLKKAESQARESQIEASLERVRARTMAMHKSDELAETAAVLFQQMIELGVTPERLNICLIKEETKILEVWSTDQEGIKINHHFNASLDEPTTGKRVYDAWKEKKKSLIIDLSGQELNDWIRYVREVMGMTIKEELVKEHRIHSVAFFSHGMVLTTTPEPLPEDSIKLLERFSDVFNLTYSRFLDLKKAEAQVKEAKIEASLERVRAKAMAMHTSDDLAYTVDTFFSELNTLNVMPHRCGVGIINPETRIVDVNATTATQENEIKKITGKLKLSGHPVLDKIFENWKLQKEYHPVLRGKEILEYYQVMNPQVRFPDFANDETQYGYYFFFKEGGVFGWTEKELTESDLKIFRRFTSVLSLTYRRYLDLKESEARALEAIKKSSLDRVRAEIASMRCTEDLNRITPIIWRELKTLEVPFFRCGVFIVDKDKSKVQVYLTTPDGKSLGVLNLPFDSNELTINTVEFWRRKEVYKEHWNKEEFISWSKSMLELGQIKSQQEYQGAEKPPESLDLHFIPFEQGMLYVGNIESLASEKIDLVKSLAETFSIAYARYEDFERLEIAKMEVESAFSNLDLLSKELKIKNEELENENQRKALELEEARQLQLSMLPKELPQLPNLDIAVYMKTATEVGGDYYDFYIQSDGTLNILIGDATGHGMKSGMMVSIMKSFFIANRNNISLKQFFDDSNDSIKNMQLGRLMMALMGVQITSTKVIATNAGMPSLVYFRNKSQKAGEFVINNLPLGAMKANKYTLKEINYESGDTLLLMSDGFAELKNQNDEQYGYARVKEEFLSVAQKSSNEIVDHLKTSADKWMNGVEPDDDVTFVVIKVK